MPNHVLTGISVQSSTVFKVPGSAGFAGAGEMCCQGNKMSLLYQVFCIYSHKNNHRLIKAHLWMVEKVFGERSLFLIALFCLYSYIQQMPREQLLCHNTMGNSPMCLGRNPGPGHYKWVRQVCLLSDPEFEGSLSRHWHQYVLHVPLGVFV